MQLVYLCDGEFEAIRCLFHPVGGGGGGASIVYISMNFAFFS